MCRSFFFIRDTDSLCKSNRSGAWIDEANLTLHTIAAMHDDIYDYN